MRNKNPYNMEGNPICKMQGCSMDKVKYNIK